MTGEEKVWVDQLLAKDSDVNAQSKALTQLGEALELCYILNLPPSKEILAALKKFAARKGQAKLVTKAKRLVKTYEI